MPAQVLVPVLITMFVVALGALIFVTVGRGASRTGERLQKLGRGQKPVAPEPTAFPMGGGEFMDQLIAPAAEKLAERLMPKKEEKISELKARLRHAGPRWRTENAVAKFLFLKMIFAGIGVVIATSFLPIFGFTRDTLFWGGPAIVLSYILPSFYIGRVVKRRQDAIFSGLPDALDLMVVCVESGLGLDAAMRKVCEEMGRTSPIISEEFRICNFQLQMGRPRREVLHDLGDRTGVDDMKSLAAILIQADKFGSSIGQALRTQSDSMRVKRRQLAEERAQQTAVKLLIPLILFIFPSIFIVTGGPAVIQFMEAMKK
jgi:tight adherence protein C